MAGSDVGPERPARSSRSGAAAVSRWCGTRASRSWWAATSSSRRCRRCPASSTRHPVLRTRRFALVPLLVQGRPIGLVSADNKTSRRPVTRRGIAHLELFCQQLATSVNNARLYGETRQREKDAIVLLEVTRKLSATLKLDEVIDLISDGVIEALGCGAAGFYRWDAARGGLVLERSRNHPMDFARPLLLRPGEGVTGRAYAERRPVWCADRLADPSLVYSGPNAAAMARPDAPRAFAATPILIRDEVFGVLGGSYFQPHAFTEREISLLSSLAAQGAVAIENARLYSVTQQNLAGAALLNAAARTLHRTLDVKRLLPDAAGTLAQTFGARRAGIVLFEERGAGPGDGHLVGRLEPRVGARARRAAATPGGPAPDRGLGGPRATWSPRGSSGRSEGLAAFPVRGRSRVLGGLLLLFPTPRTLTEAETRLVAAYADQLAMALDNATLFEEAENQKTRLEQVFASTSDGFLVLDLDRRVVALNRQGGALLGIDPHEVTGRPLARLIETLAGSVDVGGGGRAALVAAVEQRGRPGGRRPRGAAPRAAHAPLADHPDAGPARRGGRHHHHPARRDAGARDRPHEDRVRLDGLARAAHAAHVHQGVAAPAALRRRPRARRDPAPPGGHLAQEHRPAHPAHQQHPRHLEDGGGPHPSRPGAAPPAGLRRDGGGGDPGLRGVARHRARVPRDHRPADGAGGLRPDGPGGDQPALQRDQVLARSAASSRWAPGGPAPTWRSG